MSYSNSAAFVARTTVLSYQTDPSVGYLPLAEIKSIDFSGSKFDVTDVTNYQSGVFREWLTTLADSGELSFSGNYIPADSSQQALLGLFNTGVRVSWKIVLPASANAPAPITFQGFIVSLDHNLPLDKEAMITGKIKITGPVAGL